MKRLLSVLIALVLMTTARPSLADDFGGLFGGFTDMIGAMASMDDDSSAAPDTADWFTGKTVTVKVGKSKLKVHEGFKHAMDEYEAFFDEYIRFMKNPDMSKYSQFMTQYAETMAALDAVADADMTDDELAYYTAVMLRIDEKLLSAVQ